MFKKVAGSAWAFAHDPRKVDSAVRVCKVDGLVVKVVAAMKYVLQGPHGARVSAVKAAPELRELQAPAVETALEQSLQSPVK